MTDGPTPQTSLGRSARLGAHYATFGAFGTWLVDFFSLVGPRGAAGPDSKFVGLGSALFVAMSASFLVGGLVGPVVVPLAESTAGEFRRTWEGLRRGDTDVRRELSARILGGAFLTVAALVAAHRLSVVVPLEVRASRIDRVRADRQPHVRRRARDRDGEGDRRVARSVVDAAANVRGLGFLVDHGARPRARVRARDLRHVVARREEPRGRESALPWRNLTPFGGLLVGLGFGGVTAEPRDAFRRTLHRIAVGVGITTFFASAIAAARLRPETTTALRMAFTRAWSGRVGYAAWEFVLDVDRDGQIGTLGGGDCAPFDPKRYAGAVDVPDNGVDEDCDGHDASNSSIRPRARVEVGQHALSYRPSIVLVTVDGLSARRLVALGSPRPVMPNVDEFAERGALFTHCFAQGPSTRLSLPAMFTSRWDSQLEQVYAPRHPYPLASGERQIQDVMNDAGYETVAVISDDYFQAPTWPSATRGFQRVDKSAIPFGVHNAVQVTDAALKVVNGAHDRPYFLWVHYFDAHAPYVKFPDAPETNPSDEEMYRAELSFVDRELGRLFGALESKAEPPYVAFTSDHGTVFHPDPSLRTGHYGYDLYTATLHVPLILRGPGIDPRRVDGLVSTMDVVPTFADLLQLGDAGFQGTSLAPEVFRGDVDPTRTLFHEFFLQERAFRGEDPLSLVSVRDGRWNLVLDRTTGHYELYDWTTDYWEVKDRYEENGRAPEVRRLKALLGTFLQEFHANSARH
ncbi:MAG: sulfatase [Polyangiaceae bacterium]